MTHRDTAGKTLDEYPRPSVAVDTAVLTVTSGETDDGVTGSASGDGVTGTGRLAVLLTRPSDDAPWRLPGTFLHPKEQLADAVRRSLHDKCGVDGVSPAQLHVFDGPDRDDRGWVLAVAHLATVPVSRLVLDPARTRLAAIDGDGRLSADDSAIGQSALPYDHDAIVAFAVAELRRRYADRPDPEGLLAEPFTILDLRRVHEAVAGRALLRDTFRRAMIDGLRATGKMQSGAVGKPAELYRRASRG